MEEIATTRDQFKAVSTRASLAMRVSPIALRISATDLAPLSPVARAERLRDASVELARIADELCGGR